MNLNATFRPIDRWPGELTRRRQPSRFRAPWPETLDLLKRELAHLGARSVVIQLALTEREIRLDGYPRAHARPAHPGVILAFESKYGPLKYATDAFGDWQDNIRAIALGLEALRKVDRYGITRRGEQYTGWKALPGAGGSSSTLTAEAAARFVADLAGNRTVPAEALLRDPHVLRGAYRVAAQRAHPDTGGSTEAFQRLQEAKAVLDRHHGGVA